MDILSLARSGEEMGMKRGDRKEKRNEFGFSPRSLEQSPKSDPNGFGGGMETSVEEPSLEDIERGDFLSNEFDAGNIG